MDGDGSGDEDDMELLEANRNYMRMSAAIELDTSKVEEVPAKEPKPNAQPVKSALKKIRGSGGSGSGTSTPTQETAKSLIVKHEQLSK